MSSFSLPRGAVPYRSRLGWLPASLALNLILAGVLVAWVADRPAPKRQPLVTWQRDLVPSLSQDDAAIVTEGAALIADTQNAGDQGIHQQYAKIRAILAVDPIDRAGLDAAFAEMAAIRHNQQLSVGHAFRDELATVSPDGRRKILSAMQKESERFKPSPPGH
jgi:hypothetical protein